MREPHRRPTLIAVIAILLGVAFIVTTLSSFFVSRGQMRDAIVSDELPLTADTIYSEIQRDLIQPIFVSSMMANDTFFRDWVISGEKNVPDIAKYLREIKDKYGTVSSFFVSENTHRYYTADGILKTVSESEWRDVWYFRVRDLESPYEINVDPDLANGDTLTIFINYKIFDYSHNFIGSCGVGLAIHSVQQLIGRYQQSFGRKVYFVDAKGKIVVSSDESLSGHDVHAAEGLSKIIDHVLNGKGGSFEYRQADGTHLLSVRFIPELNWYVFVEKIEEQALEGIRHVLYANLAIALLATIIVLGAVTLTIGRFQRRLEEMAMIDGLTGLANRQSYEILIRQAVKDSQRTGLRVNLILFDIDHFKEINDQYGHLVGDSVLRIVANEGFFGLRESDIACRWGGEEFLLLLRDCSIADAMTLAEKIRSNVATLTFPELPADIRLTVSAGVAQLQPEEDQTGVLRRADRALYIAKEKGRNQVVMG